MQYKFYIGIRTIYIFNISMRFLLIFENEKIPDFCVVNWYSWYNKKLHIILDLGDKKKPHRIILIFLRKIQFDLSYDIFVEICNFKIIPE